MIKKEAWLALKERRMMEKWDNEVTSAQSTAGSVCPISHRQQVRLTVRALSPRTVRVRNGQRCVSSPFFLLTHLFLHLPHTCWLILLVYVCADG